MKGRPPVPTALKILRGNPGKRPLSDAEPSPQAALPSCPSELTAEGRKLWAAIGAELLVAGVLTTMDGPALKFYVQACVRELCAIRGLKKTGGPVITEESGRLVKNPWVHELNAARVDIAKSHQEFGMTPASRTRVKVAGKQTTTLSDFSKQKDVV